ncbi:MAG: hypothetical protein K2N76_05800, partial [Muribaculaceae bacterium]|nr:hypothetical protein [Muribaculaceae bacterium]
MAGSLSAHRAEGLTSQKNPKRRSNSKATDANTKAPDVEPLCLAVLVKNSKMNAKMGIISFFNIWP